MSIENIININVPDLHFRKIQCGLCSYFIIPKGVYFDFKNNLIHFKNMKDSEFEDSENLFKVTYVDAVSSGYINIVSIARV